MNNTLLQNEFKLINLDEEIKSIIFFGCWPKVLYSDVYIETRRVSSHSETGG